LAETIKTYQNLIAKMPKPNQYLLLYVLDLLSVFARKSEVNLMTAPSELGVGWTSDSDSELMNARSPSLAPRPRRHFPTGYYLPH